MNKVSIFDGRYERLNLWLCFFFVPFVALDLSIGIGSHPNPDVTLMWFTVYSFLFLSAIHNGFTFVMLFAFPEFRKLGFNRIFRGMLPEKATVAILLFAIGAAGSLTYYKLLPLSLLKFFWIADILVNTAHPLGQVRGLGYLYNREAEAKLGFTDAEKAEVRRLERIDVRLYQATFGLIVFGALSLPFNFSSRWNFLLVLIPTTLLVFNSMRYPKAKQSNRTMFLSRLLLMPFNVMSPTAFMAGKSMHGVEYFFLFEKMFSRSRVYKTVLATIFIGVGCVVFSGFVHMRAVNERLDLVPMGETAMMFLVPLHCIVVYGHVVLDKFIFRFRDPVVREAILPLVSNSRKTAS